MSQRRRSLLLPRAAALTALLVAQCAACSPDDSLVETRAFAADKFTDSPPVAASTSGVHALASTSETPDEARPTADVKAADTPLPSAEQFAASDLSYKEVIAPDRPYEGAVSVGSTLAGRIRGESVQVPEDNEQLALLAMCQDRETNYGTEEIVQLLVDTATAVADEFPGPPLLYCNLSRKHGRNLPWSRSHNSGRDVDITFFSLEQGARVAPTLMMRFRGDLTTGADENVTFDLDRNWVLVKHLLSHPTIQVQWIFVYHRLRKALLRYAKETGEDEALIHKAELVMLQPSDSSPHRDHFHVRVYCAPNDAADGCLNDGPLWPWIEQRWNEPLARRGAAMAPGFLDPDFDTRAAVLDYVVESRGYDSSPGIAAMAILDPRSELRVKATDVLVEWQARERDAVYAIEDYLRAPGGGFAQADPTFERTPVPRAAENGYHAVYNFGNTESRSSLLVTRAYRLLGKMATVDAGPFLAEALGSKRILDDETGTPEALLAAKAAQDVMDLGLVPALIDALEHEDGRVRREANLALRRITNNRLGAAWGDAVEPERRQKNVEMWRQWWRENKDESRETLLVRGFRHRGVPVKHLEQEGIVDVLLKAVPRPTEVGYNADRVLAELTGQWSPRDSSPEAKAARWKRWREQQKGVIKLRRVTDEEYATFDRHGLHVKRFSWQPEP